MTTISNRYRGQRMKCNKKITCILENERKADLK